MMKIVERILSVFENYNAGETACDKEHFRQRITRYVAENKTIPFVILAFPCKSINENSVSGHLPDLGEELALQTLRDLIDRVGMVYPPGMELHILSEGHCFSRTGCMRPLDQIDAYTAEIGRMKNNDRIKLHTIHNFYQGDTAEKVSAFEGQYMPGAEEIKEAISNDPTYSRIFLDRVAFIYNEFSRVLAPDLSVRKRQALSKMTAHVFIGCQIAVTRLVKDRFSDHVRLSIHQQHDPASQKFYIDLLPNLEGKGMPWYHVIDGDKGIMRLAKRMDVAKKDDAPKNEPYTIESLTA